MKLQISVGLRLPTPPRRRLPASLAQSIGTGVLGQLVLVASGIIVARSLGPHNRGVLALLTFLPVLVGQVATLGIPLAATYVIANSGVMPSALIRSLWRVMGLQLIVALGAHAALVGLLLVPRSPSGFFTVSAASLALSVAALVQTYGLALLQGCRRFTAFNALRVGPACLYAFLIAGLAAVHRAGLHSVAIAWILANCILAALTGWAALRARSERSRPMATVPSIGSLASFGARSMFGAAAPMSSYRLDQLIVGAALRPEMLGLYVVATAFTNLTRFLGQSIGMVAYPAIAVDRDAVRLRRQIRFYFGVGAVVCSSVTAGLVIAVPWLLPRFFGHQFDPAIGPARLLLAAGLLSALRRILVDATRGAGHPTWGALAELSTLVSLPLAILALDARLGLIGVSIALIVGEGVGLGIRASVSLRATRSTG